MKQKVGEVIKKIREKFINQGDNLQGKTLKAAMWSLLGSGGRGAIRFISNLLLTRLLFPEAFGIMATAMVVVTLVQVFSDTGAKTALIQNPRGGEKRFIDTSFLIALGRSLILFIIIIAAIEPVADFYGEPALSGILLIMSFALLAEGFVNPALPLLIKNLRVEKQVVYAIGSQLAGFMTTLILVYTLRTVEALAFGYLATSLYRVIASYMVSPYLPRFSWDKEAGLELMHFGKFIIVNTLIGWAVLNIDRLVIGKVLDMEQLAYYNIALYLGAYVSEVLVQVFAQSYFPAVSSIANDIKRVQQVYKKTLSTLISLVAPFMMLLVLFADEAIQVLYDPRYALAGSILFWISLKSFFHFIAHLQSGTLTAVGKPSYVTIANGTGFLFIALTLPEMTRQYGLTGAGITMLISTLIVGIFQSALLVRKMNFDLYVVTRPWLHLIGVGVFMSTVYAWLAGVDTLAQRHFAFMLVPMILIAGATAMLSFSAKANGKIVNAITGVFK